MATVSTAVASADLTGAGSSLVAPIMANWTRDFKIKTGINVTYGSVGSGAGIAQITARTVDFGASDAPLTSSQAAACNGCTQIPWALTAVGVGYHIRGVKHLKLDGSTLANIYLGRIKKWNDRRIRKLNKHVHLPNLTITPVFRSDGSGDTYAFTDYLSRVSGAWKHSVGHATAVGFPTGVGGLHNDGVAGTVSATNGAIGYISGAYLIATGLHAAQMKNKAGKFEYPNLKNISNAAAIVKKVPRNNEMHIVNPPKRAKIAYPISTFTYCLAPHGAPQKGDLSRFILYSMTTGQKYGPALDFAALPKVVLKAAKRTLNGL
jgi:phosphate transport system substrate-binding protein